MYRVAQNKRSHQKRQFIGNHKSFYIKISDLHHMKTEKLLHNADFLPFHPTDYIIYFYSCRVGHDRILK